MLHACVIWGVINMLHDMLHADAINLEELESQGRQLDALQDMEAPEGAYRWAVMQHVPLSSK